MCRVHDVVHIGEIVALAEVVLAKPDMATRRTTLYFVEAILVLARQLRTQDVDPNEISSRSRSSIQHAKPVLGLGEETAFQ
jgi:hypothetical protein